MRVIATVLLAVSLKACSAPTDISEPPSLIGDELGGLTASVAISASAVRPYQEFTLTFTLANPTENTVELHTPSGCLVLPHVQRNGERVPFEGTAWACTAALTTHVFPPGYEQTTVFALRAALYAQHPGDVDGAAAPVGSYSVQMVFETTDRPAIGRTVVVH